MSTIYTNDPAFDVEPRAQRPYACSDGPQGSNDGPWFDDFRPAPQPVAQNSVSIGKRTLAMAALATAGAGVALGLFAFNFTSASPDPADTNVIIPEFSTEQGPASVPAPNVAVPPADSGQRGAIVTVPPSVSSGGRGNPATGAQNPAQTQDPGTKQDPDQKKNDDTKKDPDQKKNDDTKKDPGKQNPPPPPPDEPFVPPDVEGPLKKGGDIYTMPPDIVPVPKGPIAGNGDIYTAPPPPPIIDCTLGLNC